MDRIVRGTRVLTWVCTPNLGVLARVRPRTARALTLALVGTVGIAHGATDVGALGRIGFRPRGGAATLSIGYGVLAVATFVTARRMPKLASRALYGLSAWHFGSGDLAFARAASSAVHGVPDALLRGVMPLSISGTVGASYAVASATALRAAWHLRAGEPADALDLAIPTVLLLGSKPREGFAVYFGAWHALRHTALLLARDPRGGSERERSLRFARESTPNTLIAIAAGVVAYFLDRRSSAMRAADDDVFGALILAITVPHQLAVGLLERHATR